MSTEKLREQFTKETGCVPTYENSQGFDLQNWKYADWLEEKLSKEYAKQSKQEEVKGYWWCPECKIEVDSLNVTFHEFHDACGTSVEWKELKPQPQEKVLSEKEYLLDNLKEFPNHDEYDPKLIDAISDFMNGFANYRLNTIQDNGLREAAKRVVLMIERDIAELENPNNSIGGMCTVRGKLATIKGYKDELEKALK